MITNDEQIILAAVAQNQMSDIQHSGIFKWRFHDPYDRILKACQIIHLRGQPVTLLSLHAECELHPDEWPPIREVWQEAKNTTKIDWRTAASRIINRAMREQGLETLEESDRLLQSTADPRKVLSATVTQLSTLMDNGATYNPTPSFHYHEGVMGDVVGSTGLPTIDRLLFGGLWTQALIGVALPSNHGKSTLTYTLLACSVKMRRKCQLFTFETDTPRAVARVLSALTGVNLSETVARKGLTPESQEKIDQGLKEIDKYFSIYDGTFNDSAKMEQAIRLERPALACVDHITMPPPLAARRNGSQWDQIGDLCDLALQWTIKYSLTVILNSQLDNATQLELKRTHDLVHTKMFGSSRIYNALDFALIGLRHWTMPNTAYFRLKKNRPKGVIDIDAVLHHNSMTQAYEETEK